MALKTLVTGNDTVTISDNNMSVVGEAGGSQKVKIAAGITGLTTNADVDSIDLAGNLADFTFVNVVGTGTQIRNAAGIVVATVPSVNNTTGIPVAFANGTATLLQTATGFTLGSAAVPTTAAAITTAALGTTFDTNVKSTVTTTTTTPVVAAGAFTMTSNAVAGVATAEGNTITLTITPTAALAAATTLNLNVTGQALGGYTSTTTAADFGTIPSVSFAAGATAAQTVSITVASDTTAEGIEAYKIALLNSVGVEVATALTGIVNDAPTTNTGNAFTLATGIDNVTAPNAVISALIDQNTGTNTTWNLSDTIAPASAGTLNLSVITASAALAGYNTSGVTTLNVKPIDNASTATTPSFDVGSMTGLTKVSIANGSVIGSTADTYTINSTPATASVDINTNGSAQNITANYASAATAGAADIANVSVTGRSGSFLLSTGFETLSVTGGTAARLAAANSETTATIKTVKVTGTDLKVDGALDTTVTSVDASAATGVVNLAVTTPTGTFSAKGGTGLSDVLALSTLASTQTVTGFETLVATAASTYDLTGTDAVNLGVGVGAGNVSFTNATATQNQVVIGGLQQRTTAPSATASLTTGGTVTWALKTATGTADTLNIAVNNGGTASTGTQTIGGAITTSAVENVNLAMTDWKAVTIGGAITIAPTSTANGKFVATGASNLSLTTNAVTFSGGLGTGTDIVDLTGLTGTFTGALSQGSGNLTFTGGAGVTTLTTSAPVTSKVEDITTGAANDIVTVTSLGTTAGTVKVNTGAGDDRITLDATVTQTTASQVISIDGGAGSDTLAPVGTGNSKTINATIANIENLQLEADTAATSLNLTVASGYADTVRIVDASGVTQSLLFNTSAGGTVNLSKFTTVGWTSGTDVLGVVSNTGNETFTFGALTSGGAAVAETVKLTAPSTDGKDVVVGFAAGDIVNVNTAGSTANTYLEGAVAAVANTDELCVITGAAIADVAALYAAGAFSAASPSVIVFLDSDTNTVKVAYDADGETATVAPIEVLELTGITTLAGLAAAFASGQITIY